MEKTEYFQVAIDTLEAKVGELRKIEKPDWKTESDIFLLEKAIQVLKDYVEGPSTPF